MTLFVVGAVLAAAALHGSWNAIAKSVPSTLAASALIGLTGLCVGVVGQFLFPGPEPASIPYIVISSVAQSAYILLLTATYRHMEFSKAYPLARGLSVLLVTLFSTLVLREELSVVQLAGVVAAVVVALLGLVFAGGHPSAAAYSSRGLALVGLTGATIAFYTVVDGVGVRQSTSPIGYSMWLFTVQGMLIPLLCWALARGKVALWHQMGRYWLPGIAAGLMSAAAYAIVVWAQSVAPLAVVSALRETSILFAGVIGVLVFNERLSPVRGVAMMVAVLGVAAMQIG